MSGHYECCRTPRLRKVQLQPQQWLNDESRNLRRSCRKAEQRWRKDRLQISYEMLKDALSKYQNAVKVARRKYFSDLINRSPRCPKALFAALNSVLSPAKNLNVDSTSPTADDFLNFFVQKVENIRKEIVPLNAGIKLFSPCSCIFTSFEQIS